jgi:EpsI family protein
VNARPLSKIVIRVRVSIIPWLAVLTVAVAAVYGLASLWEPLHSAWSGIYGAFSHGYLALVLSVWLGVTYWRRNPPSELRPKWIAAVALLGLVTSLVAMDLLFLQSSRLTLLPLLVLAAVACVFGVEALSVLIWPTLYLYCALPQWWIINSTLQSFTSRVVSALVEITRLPAYVEGNFIHVPAGIFEIASGCSGLNYLVASLSLAGFFALMHLTKWRRRLYLLGVAAALALLSNLLRVYLLIVIGIVTDMQHYLIRVEHLYFGWVLFLFAMVPMLWLARRLEAAEIAERQPLPAECVVVPAPSVAPSVLLGAVVAAVIVLIPCFAFVPEADAEVVIADLPRSVSEWTQTPSPARQWRPVFVNADEQRADYSMQSQRVEVYRGFYSHQTSDRRVVRADNDFGGAGWRQAEQRTVDASGTGFAPVQESRGYLYDEERLIWSWYVVAGKPANTKLQAKLREITGLFSRRRDSMALALSTECLPDCDAARARLAAFTQESGASLQP